jgi:hypothetical protein
MQETIGHPPGEPGPVPDHDKPVAARGAVSTVREIGGPKGPEPTRYGDWEKAGRCIDF